VFSPKPAAENDYAQNQAMQGRGVPGRPIAAGSGVSSTTPEIQPATIDAAALIRNADGIQNIQTPPSATAIQETNFFINGMQPTESYRIESRDGEAAARVTINVPRPTTVAVPDVLYESRSSAPARPAAPAAARPAPAASPTPAAARPAANAAPARPAAQTRTHTDYWVQTGAFSTKSNAEGVKQTLSSKGITSIIENRVIDGRTIYQVRVGPYTTENEAKYWLTLVQAIDGFSDSLIRQSTSVR
jgi:DedD protein